MADEFHVEFKVGKSRWYSACDTLSTRAEAREWIRGSKAELKAEGNPLGKWRVVAGPPRAEKHCGPARKSKEGLVRFALASVVVLIGGYGLVRAFKKPAVV